MAKKTVTTEKKPARGRSAAVKKEAVAPIAAENNLPNSELLTPVKSNYKNLVLKNTKGEDMDPADYFFKEDATGEVKVPVYFNKVCGLPVDREDLLEIFNRIFKPEDNILFYKTKNKEVYVIIVPLKYAEIGKEHDSRDGDHQKHAISFISEGSANVDMLKTKLMRVAKSIRYSDR